MTTDKYGFRKLLAVFAALYCDLVKAACGGRKLIDTAAKALGIRTKEQCVYLVAIERRKTVRIRARGEFIVELAKAIQKGGNRRMIRPRDNMISTGN
jgi:hypothetical protein